MKGQNYNLKPIRQRNWGNFKTWCKANDTPVRKAIEDLIEQKLLNEGVPVEKIEFEAE